MLPNVTFLCICHEYQPSCLTEIPTRQNPTMVGICQYQEWWDFVSSKVPSHIDRYDEVLD